MEDGKATRSRSRVTAAPLDPGDTGDPNDKAKRKDKKVPRSQGGSPLESPSLINFGGLEQESTQPLTSTSSEYVIVDPLLRGPKGHPGTLHDLPDFEQGSVTTLEGRLNTGRRLLVDDADFVLEPSHQNKANRRGMQMTGLATRDRLLEHWWFESPNWRRNLPLILIVIGLIAILNLGVAIYTFSVTEKWDEVEDPYVCRTEACKNVSKWLLDGLNSKVSPCDDFYEFACGGYRDERDETIYKKTSFPQLDLHFVRFGYNAEGKTPNILKYFGDPTDIVIPFYKSCINMRERKADGLRTLAVMINETLYPTFTAITDGSWNEDKLINETVTIGDAVGGFGIFQYELLEGRKIVLYYPDWMETYEYLTGSTSDTSEFDRILKLYVQDLWVALRFEKDKEPISPDDVVTNVKSMIKACLEIYKEAKEYKKFTPHDDETLTILKDANKRYKRVLERSLRTKDFSLRKSSIQPSKYYIDTLDDSDLDLIGILHPTIMKFMGCPTSQSQPQCEDSKWQPKLYASFWIFYLSRHFVSSLHPEVGQKYINIFDYGRLSNLEERKSTFDVQCLRSIILHSNVLLKLRLSRVYDPAEAAEIRSTVHELKRQVFRKFRHSYFNSRKKDESPAIAYLSEIFMQPNRSVQLTIPNLWDEFDDPEDLKKFRDMVYNQGIPPGGKWKPQENNYVRNTFYSKRLYLKAKILDWTMPFFKQRGDGLLDYVETDIQDFYTSYKDWIRLPYLAVDFPYHNKDMRVFEYSGLAIQLIAAFADLYQKHIDDPISLGVNRALYNKLLSVPTIGFPDPYSRPCTLSEEAQYLSENVFWDAEIISEAYSLFEESSKIFESQRLKNGKFCEFIEPIFSLDQETEYVDIRTSPFKKVNLEDLRDLDLSPNYKLKYRRLWGLEEYTDSQLFFIKAIRHLCISSHHIDTMPEEVKIYREHVNNVLTRLTLQFGAAWQCPLGSRMNPGPSTICA